MDRGQLVQRKDIQHISQWMLFCASRQLDPMRPTVPRNLWIPLLWKVLASRKCILPLHGLQTVITRRISLIGMLMHWFTVQGLSIPFACVGSGDPVRVLRLYTTNTLDIFWSIYCWGICTTCHYQFYCVLLKPYALRLPTAACVCVWVWVCLSLSLSVFFAHCTVRCFIYCLCRC